MKYAIITITISILSLTFFSQSQSTRVELTYFSTLPTVKVMAFSYTQYELDLCARLIAAESYNEPQEGQIAVLDVVRNRLLYHPRKKYNSLSKVILTPGQFDGVGTRNWDNPAKKHYKLAKQYLEGQITSVLDSTYFYFHNPNKDKYGNYISTDRTHVRLVEQNPYVDIGNHRFCKRS